MCPEEEEWSAANFFGLMIKIVNPLPAGKPLNGHPRGLMMLWLAITDPQHITEHSETGYSQLRGVITVEV
jgi:hypothetical protein